MIIFIGAGVSKLFGIPDMKGFTAVFDNYPRISNSEIYGRVKNAFGSDFDLEILMTILDDLGRNRNDILKRISPQTTDFLLRNIERRDHFLDDESVKTEAKELITHIKNIIVAECMKADKNTQKILETYDNFLQTLARTTPNRQQSGDLRSRYPKELAIFTTNYDRCIETYLGLRKIDFNQGLRQRFGYNAFDVSSYDDEETNVEVFKLHGSIDLFNVDGLIRQRKHGEDSGEEVVYYPLEFGGYNHIIESPYLELFYLFRERLRRERGDNKWILIGTSLRDRTICSIMNDVIRLEPEAKRPKIAFVNPDTRVVDRLKSWEFVHLADQIKIVPYLFGPEETNKAIQNVL